MDDKFAAMAAKITGPCSCHESYRKRGLIAPDCNFHEFSQEIADALREAYNAGAAAGRSYSDADEGR